MKEWKRQTPVPRKVLIVVIIVQFAEAFQVSVLFPFLPFMVASFSTVDPEDVGFYSGLLAAAFVLGQLISSYPWGMLSDRFGEKMIVLISLGLTFASSLLFGFTSEFYQAYLARFLAGLLNGNIGVIKTYLGKNTDTTNQGKAFGLVSAAWVIGNIVAPAIGGYLAEPADKYPEVFDPNGFFGKFPYILPTLCTALVLLVSLLASFYLIEDDKFPPKPLLRAWDTVTDALLRVLPACCRGKILPRSRRFRKGAAAATSGGGGSATAARKRPHRSRYRPAKQRDESDSESELALDEVVAAARQVSADGDLGVTSPGGDEGVGGGGSVSAVVSGAEEADDANLLAVEEDSPPNSSLSVAPARVPLARAEFMQMLFAALMYSGVGFVFIGLDETFPLFCRSAVDQGGLGFQTDQIGLALSIMGVIEIIYIIFFFPRVNARFRDLSIFRWSLVIFIPVIALYPLSNILAGLEAEWALWTYLLVNLGLRGVSSTNVYTPVMIFINNSVPKHYMGRANGIGQAFVAAFRAVAPPLVGYIWSVSSVASYPLHNWTVFLLLAAASGALLGLSRFYQKGIELSYEERKALVAPQAATTTVASGEEAV